MDGGYTLSGVAPTLPLRQEFDVPKLGTVVIDASNSQKPRLVISLDAGYAGELRDHMSKGEPLYLDCDSSSCATDLDVQLRIKAFAEVLYHHDYDRDGTFDADHVLAAIEDAMWESTESPFVFERPNKGLYTRFLMKLLSVAPPPERHVAYSFGELRKRFRPVDYLWAIPLIGVFIGLVQLQFAVAPWTHYSVLSAYFELMDKVVGVSHWVAIAILAAVITLWWKRSKSDRTESPHTYGLFNKAALWEEQVWRENAHNWNFGQRLVSCLTFGAIHMVNLFYPLASILPLAVAGGVFMFIYLRSYKRYRAEGRVHARRDATLRAALAHRLYNRCALALIVIVIGLMVYQGSLDLIAAFAMIGTVITLIIKDRRRHIER